MNPNETQKNQGKARKGKRSNSVTYSFALAEELCDGLLEGRSLREVCQRPDMPSMASVLRWLGQKPAFAALYARARDLQADLLVEEVLAELPSMAEDNKEVLSAVRLRLEGRKWAVSAFRPRKDWDAVAAQQTQDLEQELFEQRLRRAHRRLGQKDLPPKKEET